MSRSLLLLCATAALLAVAAAKPQKLRHGFCLMPGTPLPEEELGANMDDVDLDLNATVPQHSMGRNRLGLSKHHKRYVLSGNSPGKWGSPNMGTAARVTYSFPSGSGSCEAGSGCVHLSTFLPAGWKDAVVMALNAWSKVAGLTFVEVADDNAPFNRYVGPSQGDLRFMGHNLDGRSGQLAHGYYPPTNGVTASGDIHLDTSESWNVRTDGLMYNDAYGGISVAQVLAHEIGHALGLAHDSSAAQALMDPYYSESFFGPLQDDINAMRLLYGPPAYQPPATSAPRTNPPATNPPRTNPPATNPPRTDPPCQCSGVSACCDGCRFRAAGTLCRASSGPCDPQETCTGNSASCPADARTGAGRPCSQCGSTGTCNWQGVCSARQACCGDGLVQSWEVCDKRLTSCCSADCQTKGNGRCDWGETCANCPNDCCSASKCGNGICEKGEYCGDRCGRDCGVAGVYCCSPTAKTCVGACTLNQCRFA